jgi:transposase
VALCWWKRIWWLCAHFDHPAVSNGPTENLNLKIKNTKRLIAHGYRNFRHYRLRLLLNHGRTAARTCRLIGAVPAGSAGF